LLGTIQGGRYYPVSAIGAIATHTNTVHWSAREANAQTAPRNYHALVQLFYDTDTKAPKGDPSLGILTITEYASGETHIDNDGEIASQFFDLEPLEAVNNGQLSAGKWYALLGHSRLMRPSTHVMRSC
jgi:hypothetical protein